MLHCIFFCCLFVLLCTTAASTEYLCVQCCVTVTVSSKLRGKNSGMVPLFWITMTAYSVLWCDGMGCSVVGNRRVERRAPTTEWRDENLFGIRWGGKKGDAGWMKWSRIACCCYMWKFSQVQSALFTRLAHIILGLLYILYFLCSR